MTEPVSKTKRGPGRPRIHPTIKAQIWELSESGWNMKQIHDELELRGDPVHYGTIRNILKGRPHDPAQPWRLQAPEGLADGYPDVVFDVLVDVWAATDGRVGEVSSRVADWIVALRLAVPDLGGWACFLLARRYRDFELTERDLSALDRLLLRARQRRVDTREDQTAAGTPEERELAVLFIQVASADFAARTGAAVKVSPPAANETDTGEEEPGEEKPTRTRRPSKR